MPIACPLCATQHRDMFSLSVHLEDDHPDDKHRVTCCMSETLPVIEIDIDKIHRAYAGIGALATGQGS